MGQPPLPPGADPYFTLYQGSLGASWQLDLFGRVRRLSEAAQAQVYASEQAQRGVVLAVVSAVASSYIGLRALDRQLEIAQATAANFGETARIFELRFRAGAVSQTEVVQIRSQYLQALAAIPAFQQQIAAQENLISILLGRNPGPIPRGKTIDQLVAPLIPADLPSALLQRRPDILQAEQNLVAANANIGATRALYYPTISLTGTLGSVSTAFGNFLSGPASAALLGASLVGPIFTFGAIEGQVRSAEAQQQQAVFFYQRTVLGAFRETNDALTALAAQDRGSRAAGRARHGVARVRPAFEAQVRQGRGGLPRGARRRERALRRRTRVGAPARRPLHPGRQRLPGHGRRLGDPRRFDRGAAARRGGRETRRAVTARPAAAAQSAQPPAPAGARGGGMSLREPYLCEYTHVNSAPNRKICAE